MRASGFRTAAPLQAGQAKSLPAPSPHNRRCRLVEGVTPHRKREEVGIVPFEVLHVGEPLPDEPAVYPFDIPGEVLDIALREPGEPLPPFEFLGEVEDRPE